MAELIHDDILEVLISEKKIRARVRALGARITQDYAGKTPFFLGVLKGSYVFMADLTRCVALPCTMDFMAVSSYGGGTSTTGAVRITKDLTHDIEGKDVIIVEDILDTGRTLHYIMELLQARRPRSIRICTLLDKPERRAAPVSAEYVGFTVPDKFVVGYGLDYKGYYRNLPYVGVLSPRVYEEQ